MRQVKESINDNLRQRRVENKTEAQGHVKSLNDELTYIKTQKNISLSFYKNANK